jgi:hypothetical protein
MRRLVALVALCATFGLAHSQQHAPQPAKPVASEAKASKRDASDASAPQAIAVTLPARANVTLSGTLQVKSEYVDKSTREEPNEWRSPITWFTLVIMVANIALWISTNGLAQEAASAGRTANQAVELAREEFIAAYGPRLVLRTAVVREEKPDGSDHSDLHVAFILHNAGRSEAVITHSEIDSEVLSALEHFPPMLVQHNQLGSIKFAPGEEMAFKYHPKPEVAANLNITSLSRLARQGQGLFFAIALRYADAKGNTRTNYTVRRYDSDRDGFVRTGNPDDEYEG